MSAARHERSFHNRSLREKAVASLPCEHRFREILSPRGARVCPRNMIVRLGSGSVRTTRRAHMSEPMFLTFNEVIERYRGQISEGTLRNWRSMRVGPSFLKIGKAVLYPLEELDRWDRRNLIVCRP